MRRLASPRAVVAGSALVLAVNAAILLPAAANRSGSPEALLHVTERELSLPPARERDNRMLALALDTALESPAPLRRAAMWRGRRLPRFELPWLDDAKLGELGVPARERSSRSGAGGGRDAAAWPMERRVFVVLEHEGEAWTRWLAAREAEVAALRESLARGAISPKEVDEAEAFLAFDRISRSRLVPVDAGLDRRELRRRFPDGGRHAIVTAVVAPAWQGPRGEADETGATLRLVPEPAVTVPRGARSLLEPFVPEGSIEDVERRERDAAEKAWPEPRPPRYAVVLAIGRRGAPWIVEASALPPAPQPSSMR